LRSELAEKVTRAVSRLVEGGVLPAAAYPPVEVSDTKSPEHGDFACNFAMAASKLAGMPPRAVGEALAAELSADSDFAKVEVAGPGFVNLTLSPTAIARALGTVLADPTGFYRSRPERALKINVEYVSVNPNGPITIGSGRGAAYGSTLCSVLEAAGHTVHREYYINDGVNSEQMRLFAESVKAILEGRPVPENGYKGDYVHEVAAALKSRYDAYDLSDISALCQVQTDSQGAMLGKQREDLAAFGVEFDTWFSEQSLHDSGAVAEELNHLVKSGAADDKEYRLKLKFGKGGEIEDVTVESQASEDDEGPNDPTYDEIEKREMTSEGSVARVNETLWLRSTKFGDDMDRVLRRRDGRLTYIASDVAYHKDKFNRPPGADKLITVLGPDHHGYIGRLTAVVAADLLGESQSSSPESRVTGPESRVTGHADVFSDSDSQVWKDAGEKAACMAALAEAREKLTVQIFQLVRFMKDGKPSPMRKRDGNIYALIDLIDEIGEKVQPDGSLEEKRRSGRDVARFFYLMRNHDTTFDFDLDLAEKQSEDNPVFYAQYAHARVCGVIEKAREAGIGNAPSLTLPHASHGRGDSLVLLTHPKEKALIVKLQDLGNEVERCAEDYGVNRLATYAVELARTYHHFYDACRVIQPDQPELSAARLALCEATRASLRAVFSLLGISAPERM
jgi:arginyl-tRNA synthetase